LKSACAQQGDGQSHAAAKEGHHEDRLSTASMIPF
jgi:hypothetical protein